LKPKTRAARKILVASMGVATATFAATSCGNTSVGNLVAHFDGGPQDGAKSDTVDEFPMANLAVPVDVRTDTGSSGDAPADGGTKDTIDDFPVANLVAHPG
jgi:hypothetical protein